MRCSIKLCLECTASWLLIVFSIGMSKIVIKPSDTDVEVGQSTYLNCSTSSGEITWHHYPVGEKTYSNYVYSKGQLMSPYDKRFQMEIERSTGSFNLVVRNVQLEDAGLYVCQNGDGLSPGSAELIVLESNPICRSNIQQIGLIGPNNCDLTEDKIHLSYSTDYRGNIPPEISWMKVKMGNESIINGSCNISDNRIRCNSTLTIDIDMDGSFFICQTTRSTNNSLPSCSTEVAKIFYVSEQKFHMIKTVGDVVACSADTSSSSCRYRWIDVKEPSKKTVSENQTFTTTKAGWYQCKVTCDIKQHQCDFETDIVLVLNETAANSTALYVVTTLLLFLCAVSLTGLIVAVVLYRKQKKLNDTRKLEERTNLLPQVKATADSPVQPSVLRVHTGSNRRPSCISSRARSLSG